MITVCFPPIQHFELLCVFVWSSKCLEQRQSAISLTSQEFVEDGTVLDFVDKFSFKMSNREIIEKKIMNQPIYAIINKEIHRSRTK